MNRNNNRDVGFLFDNIRMTMKEAGALLGLKNTTDIKNWCLDNDVPLIETGGGAQRKRCRVLKWSLHLGMMREEKRSIESYKCKPSPKKQKTKSVSAWEE